MINKIFRIVFSDVGSPWGRDRPTGQGPFSILNYNKKTVNIFCMIPFESRRQWSKLILGIFSSMRERSKGRDRAKLIFYYKILAGKTDEYFSIILYFPCYFVFILLVRRTGKLLVYIIYRKRCNLYINLDGYTNIPSLVFSGKLLDCYLLYSTSNTKL